MAQGLNWTGGDIDRTGIRSVILPRRNERDLEEVPEELRRQLRFLFVDDAEEVLRHALTPNPADAHRPAS